MAESLGRTHRFELSCTSTNGTTRSDQDTTISRAGFFDLPFEIRLEIYKYAFHRGFIHLHGKSTWYFVLPYISRCFVHPARGPQQTVPGHGFEPECGKWLGPDCPQKLPTESLQVSKKFYAEASDVLWSTNTWHLEKADILSDVLARIGPHNRAAIRSLSLVVPWWRLCREDRDGWLRVLRGPLTETLRGLRELKVVITYFSGREKLLETGYKHQVRLLGAFSKIGLEKVEVSTRAEIPGLKGQRPCTEPARLRFAERIKCHILGEASEDAMDELAGQQRIEHDKLDGQGRRIEKRNLQDSQSLDIHLDVDHWIG